MIPGSIGVGAALCVCSITIAAAQSVLAPLVGPAKMPFSSGLEFSKPKPFGATIKQLPGKQATNATSIKGKWFHRDVQHNVMLENERIPRLFTSLYLELQPDGSYNLKYGANWDGVRDTTDPRFAAMLVDERGRFSLSGSILLLRPDTVDLTREQNGTRSHETLANDNRVYLVRLDKGSFLNIAGPCARYQVEPVCRSSRSVWYSLPGPSMR